MTYFDPATELFKFALNVHSAQPGDNSYIKVYFHQRTLKYLLSRLVIVHCFEYLEDKIKGYDSVIRECFA